MSFYRCALHIFEITEFQKSYNLFHSFARWEEKIVTKSFCDYNVLHTDYVVRKRKISNGKRVLGYF